MTFIGYQHSEIDTFTIRRYNKNDNFQNLIDTFLITDRNLNGGLGAGIYTTNNDTIFVFVNDNYPDNGIYPGYDFKIYLPKIDRTITISNIISQQNEGYKGCENPINSFQVDSIVDNSPVYFQTGEFYTSGYRAYLIH